MPPSNVQNRYSTLTWKQSANPKISFIPLSSNPQGLEKELYEKLMAGKGKYYDETGTRYWVHEHNGIKYIHRFVK